MQPTKSCMIIMSGRKALHRKRGSSKKKKKRVEKKLEETHADRYSLLLSFACLWVSLDFSRHARRLPRGSSFYVIRRIIANNEYNGTFWFLGVPPRRHKSTHALCSAHPLLCLVSPYKFVAVLLPRPSAHGQAVNLFYVYLALMPVLSLFTCIYACPPQLKHPRALNDCSYRSNPQF